MTTDVFDIGDLRRIPALFTDEDEVPADPTGVTFKMTEPDGVTTTYVSPADPEVVNDSVGNWHVDWICAKAGRHFGEFIGSGNVTASAAFEFYVKRAQTQ